MFPIFLQCTCLSVNVASAATEDNTSASHPSSSTAGLKFSALTTSYGKTLLSREDETLLEMPCNKAFLSLNYGTLWDLIH